MAQNTATMYPLSPAQQGMLFHSLDRDRSGLYVQQYCYLLRGSLDEAVFARAWENVVRRHEVLRTAFVWKGLDQPVQRVGDRAVLPISTRDWSGLTPEDQAERLEAFLAEDRSAGFDVSVAPVARGNILRMSADRFCFVWSHHHLTLDGWSNVILLKELVAQYLAVRSGVELRLPSPRPYHEYIEWLQRQDWRQHESYWRERLERVTEPTPLTFEPPALNGQLRRDKRSARMSAESWARVKRFAREHGLTAATIVQGCWALLLSRYAGQRKVLFGTTVAGRPPEMAGSEEMVGLFINVAPTLIDVDPASRVIPWLRAVQREQAIVRDSAHTPLTAIQGWSAIARGTPLFESLLSFENYPLDVFDQMSGAAAGAFELPFQIESVRIAEHSNYPLTIIASPSDTLLLEISYASDRFSSGAISRLLDQLHDAIEGIAAAPEQMTREVSRRQPDVYRCTASVPETIHAAEQLLHERFESFAASIPDAIALAYGERRISYRCLNERASKLASYLASVGVTAESRVAVCTRRNPNLIIALLGVLKAGAVYVPIDPDLPADRMALLLDDMAAPVIVTERDQYRRLPSTWAFVVDLDRDWAAIDSTPSSCCGVGPSARNLAYAIYTSGSTGRPKAVGVEHGNIARYVAAVSARLGWTEGARYALLSTSAADLGHTTLFPALCGGALHLIEEDVATDGLRLAAYLDRHSIDRVKITPSHLRALLVAAETNRLLPAETLVLGGESSPCEWVSALAQAQPRCGIWNHYGPTECTVGALAGQFTNETAARAGNLPLGEPLAGSRVFVVDSEGDSSPDGAPGELWIAGDGVSRGYLNQPALTAERFVPNHFGTNGERVYRTGDRVRRTSDGRLEFLGRYDRQVKILGYRVELAEIEIKLRGCPGVLDAVVLLDRRSGAEPRLLAYVMAAEPAPEPETLRKRLQHELPGYMMPSAFAVLDRWPLLPNGKLDRASLPEPEKPLKFAGESTAQTPVQEILAGIWREVLQVEHLAHDSDFFALGGHSLIATQVSVRVRQAFDVELPIRQIFEMPKLADLAMWIESSLEGGARAGASPIPRAERTGLLPLSFAQQRLWFFDQLMPGSAVYNVPVAVRLRGALRIRQLARTFQTIAQRHEVLRTRFIARHGVPFQIIEPNGGVHFRLVDLTAVPEAVREVLVRTIARQDVGRSFDLAHGPLMRATVLRLGDQDHALLCTLHHIVSDAWSMGVLVTEAMQLYTAYEQGVEPHLPDLPVQYADYAVWEREWLTGDVLEQHLAYWRTQLAGNLPVLRLPADSSTPEAPYFEGAVQPFEFAPELVEKLQILTRREGVTMFMVLLAGFQILLSRLTGETDIVVSTVIANRTRAQVEPLIGFFVNKVVLRTNLAGVLTVRGVLRRVREVALGAYAHQDLPFDRVVEELRPARDPGRDPFAQVGCSLEFGRPSVTLPALALEPISAAPPSAKLDLNLLIRQADSALGGVLVYSRALYEPATIARLLHRWLRLLDCLSQNPDAGVDSVWAASSGSPGEPANETTAQPDSYAQFKRARRSATAIQA